MNTSVDICLELPCIFRLIGDLLLMEIWECLTIAYTKARNQNNSIHMTVESPPPIPSQERYFDLFNISVSGKF